MVNKNSGVTLIEIVTSIVLIAVAAIASFQFMTYCDKFAVSVDKKIAAANFASETMERLYQQDYNSSDLSIGSHGTNTVNFFGGRSGTYSYNISQEQTENLITNTKYKVITVTVNWN